MGKYTDYIMKTAQDLLSVPSPSGFTHMAADFVKKEFEKEKSQIITTRQWYAPPNFWGAYQTGGFLYAFQAHLLKM